MPFVDARTSLVELVDPVEFVESRMSLVALAELTRHIAAKIKTQPNICVMWNRRE
jgi:hypothetical protein